MESFAGKLAVVTGGGGGMGRELVIQLASEGCSVAACDLSPDAVAETLRRAAEAATGGAPVTAHVCDVSDETAVNAFRDEVASEHGTDHVNLLFNNAGIFGAGSFLTDDRDAWERVFDVCWKGVYYCCRAFVPMLVASDEGHLVNTSSANVMRVVHGPGAPSTSYGAAKSAVKGFTEGLIEDFRSHAPHVKVSLVIPGGVGTEIRDNSDRILRAGRANATVTSGGTHLRAYLVGMGAPLQDVPDETIDRLMGVMQSPVFTMPPAEAAAQILDGVRAGRWRILVGLGIDGLDETVRGWDQEKLYDLGGPSLLDRDLLVGVMTLSGRYAPPGGNRLTAEYELRVGANTLACRVDNTGIGVERARADAPVATVTTDAGTFRELVTGQTGLDAAIAARRLELTGDRDKLEQLLAGVGAG
jgi:NAD(P)-dependent dehydrogenase (short-subunit alcohol dehydrogenase family)